MLLPHLNVPAVVQDGCWALVKGQQQEGGGVKKVHALPIRTSPPSQSQRPLPASRTESHGHMQGRLRNSLYSRKPWVP